MASSKLSLTFRIFKGDQLIREERLAQSIIKIGKVPSAHLRIDDESVSRMHAIVEVTGSEVSIIDLGSTRGTFINGHKINKAKLQSGDSIAIGDSRVEIAIAEAELAPLASVIVEQPAAPPPPRPAMQQAAPPPPRLPAARPTTAPFATAAPAAPAAFQTLLSESTDEPGGARAVEVAAMLGDSVIGVKHCMDPRSGKVTTATWGILAAGLVCLLASATSFYVAVDNASHNKQALDYHTRVQQKPAYSFRPHQTGAAVDWIAFGGLALGLAAMTAGLARARGERRSPFYRIGTAPGVEQPIENAPSESFPLVAPSGDDFVFNYGAGMEGELIVDGRSTPLAELAAAGRARPSATTAGAFELPIPAFARIRARTGQTTFLVSAVAKPKRQETSFLAQLEGRAAKYVAGSLALHLGILMVLYQVDIEDSGANINLSNREDLSYIARLTAQEAPPPDEEKDKDTGDGAEGASKEALAMELAEGRAGDPKVQKADGKMLVKNNNVEPQLSREQEIEAARTAGLLGSTLLRDNIKSLTSDLDFSSGFDPSNQYGPLDGLDGVGNGTFGMGRSGDGRGGGCLSPPCGIIGTGKHYKTIGGGKFAGDGYWAGNGGNGGMRGHLAQPPSYSYPREITGGLDRSIIKRYIKRAEASISYCYEKELLARPGLEGTVAIQFLITTNGNVQTASGTGFDPTVASCVAGVIKTIAFPAPKDGGNVTVNYPFTFRFAGQH